MTSMLHRAQPDFPTEQRSSETSVVAKLRQLNLDLEKAWPRPSPRKRRSRALIRFLITICIGVAGTLAWQSYGDVARQMIANSSPVLGWLAPQAAPLVQVASGQVTPANPTTPSLDLQQLKTMSPDLAAVRQSVDQLAAKLQQMAGDMATMQAAQQAILRKVSTSSPPPPRQAAAPARNAVQN
jgi:hypothetical protein